MLVTLALLLGGTTRVLREPTAHAPDDPVPGILARAPGRSPVPASVGLRVGDEATVLVDERELLPADGPQA
ncbi:hypothetical protein Q760_07110 [Cellulomonas cellasea DSM 20118]|uniref:Uncharacterized protein n=1 Tax=Cellulomonas cellasea DSM 20118 TaxID=1408250 RepID=A0A0A0BD36_9CELL|nr:hypothetical protein Q760_07110 [Cellulomonas cellasea DSM 20118]